MKLTPKLTIIFCFISVSVFGQTEVKKPSIYDYHIPKNFEECFMLLDKTMPDDEIELIRTLSEDSIWLHPKFYSGADFFYAWKISSGSKITKCMGKKVKDEALGIYIIILNLYHRYLNNENIELIELIENYKKLKQERNEIYLSIMQADTLDGIYIPKDLEDCFKQIDSFWGDSTKNEIQKMTEKTFSGMSYLSFGMWMRNNWCLWGGSRLSKYFNDLEIYHPDDMSGIILDSYYRYVNNADIKLEEQIQHYKNYWEEREKQSRKEKKREKQKRQEKSYRKKLLKIS